MRYAVLILAGILSSAHCAPHEPSRAIFLQSTFSSYDEGLFTPIGDLSSLSPSEYTRLKHPAFPSHSVRVKQTQICEGEARAYTGYIDVTEARHLFFYFFESRRDPDRDDVIYWATGGPGGSSSVGLFTELGPCRAVSSNSTERHPWSWNEHANIFFVDQPVDVGFSYADYGESTTTTLEAADDIAAFMAIFFEHFTKFKGRALHLAGESYAGRYIPVFASMIYERNTELEEAGVTPINLTSIMLGNGCTDFATMTPSYYDAQCADPTFSPVLDISSCVKMKQRVRRCKEHLAASCVNRFDAIDCKTAISFCEEALTGFFTTSVDHNAFDRSRLCPGMANLQDCYPIIRYLEDFLSDSQTQELLGVDTPKRGNFSFVSWKVAQDFEDSIDWFISPAKYYLAALLERGIRALVYVGDKDLSCNWIGNERMTLELEWSKQEEYRGQPLRAWTVNGDVAGRTRSGGGLTFATIAGAGHFAPYDKPLESLELANRWLSGVDL
ncbi:alpha/beta-hydrolase [Cubamyces lactineus]|nr:alpha/beta-hydrolase [Cubamyces lactineus]